MKAGRHFCQSREPTRLPLSCMISLELCCSTETGVSLSLLAGSKDVVKSGNRSSFESGSGATEVPLVSSDLWLAPLCDCAGELELWDSERDLACPLVLEVVGASFEKCRLLVRQLSGPPDCGELACSVLVSMLSVVLESAGAGIRACAFCFGGGIGRVMTDPPVRDLWLARRLDGISTH